MLICTYAVDDAYQQFEFDIMSKTSWAESYQKIFLLVIFFLYSFALFSASFSPFPSLLNDGTISFLWDKPKSGMTKVEEKTLVNRYFGN